MAGRENYGMKIKDYLLQIFNDFDRPTIHTLGDLRNELGDRAFKFVYANKILGKKPY